MKSVVEDLAWRRFKFHLGERGWIDWRHPSLYRGDAQWRAFAKTQHKRFPDLASDFVPTLLGLDRLRILTLPTDFVLTQRYDIDLHPVTSPARQ